MIAHGRTYQDVAREISDGLASGSVVLEGESTENELGLLAGMLFQYLTPRKVAFVAGRAGSIGAGSPAAIGGISQVMIQIDPKAYEELPEHVKASFNKRTQDLRDRGVKIKIKDLKGKPFYMPESVEMSHNSILRSSS